MFCVKRFTKTAVSMLAATFVSALLAVGCSDDDDKKDEGSPGDSPTTAIQLTANTWADGYIPSSGNGENWFRFIATANPQYIHFKPDTLNDVDVQLYDSDLNSAGDVVNLYGVGPLLRTSYTVNVGQTYYLKVTPYNDGEYGAYQIAFNSSTSLPDDGDDNPPPQLTGGDLENADDEIWANCGSLICIGFGFRSGTYYTGIEIITDLWGQVEIGTYTTSNNTVTINYHPEYQEDGIESETFMYGVSGNQLVMDIDGGRVTLTRRTGLTILNEEELCEMYVDMELFETVEECLDYINDDGDDWMFKRFAGIGGDEISIPRLPRSLLRFANPQPLMEKPTTAKPARNR